TASTDTFLAEELQAMFLAREKEPCPLGDRPVITLVGAASEPPDQSEEMKRIWDEKRRQKSGLASLSRNSKCVFAEKSGHHIQLDEPEVVVSAVREVVEAVRNHRKLKP